MLLRKVLRRHLVRVSAGTEVLRRVLRRERFIEVAEKAETRPFRRVRPPSRASYKHPFPSQTCQIDFCAMS